MAEPMIQNDLDPEAAAPSAGALGVVDGWMGWAALYAILVLLDRFYG